MELQCPLGVGSSLSACSYDSWAPGLRGYDSWAPGLRGYQHVARAKHLRVHLGNSKKQWKQSMPLAHCVTLSLHFLTFLTLTFPTCKMKILPTSHTKSRHFSNFRMLVSKQISGPHLPEIRFLQVLGGDLASTWLMWVILQLPIRKPCALSPNRSTLKIVHAVFLHYVVYLTNQY